jgi:uncharacterized coiled-coil protein SlyX
MSDPKLQHIEEKLAHLEMANAQLEDEVFRQQREIESLIRGHRGLLERLEGKQDADDSNSDGVLERPPHY